VSSSSVGSKRAAGADEPAAPNRLKSKGLRCFGAPPTVAVTEGGEGAAKEPSARDDKGVLAAFEKGMPLPLLLGEEDAKRVRSKF
jgi:hypothetical protein